MVKRDTLPVKISKQTKKPSELKSYLIGEWKAFSSCLPGIFPSWQVITKYWLDKGSVVASKNKKTKDVIVNVFKNLFSHNDKCGCAG